MIPRIPHPWAPGPFPYDVFAGTPITPAATHDEVLDASLKLMADGTLNSDTRPAFDALRLIESRLATDFFLYNPDLAAPEKAGA